MTTVIDLAVDSIKPSPSNPRKTFRNLEELADSIIASGVLQPITVRPDPSLVNEYELVLGERRWRASKLAKQATVPSLVREMTDTEVLEAQLVENVQRSDVHPLEEAQGYQSLLDHHGYTIESLAAKTGRSRAHLYGRLKLTKLAPAVRKAFLADQIGAAIAELLARIPVLKLQEAALHDIVGGSHDYTTLDELDSIGIRPEELNADGRGRIAGETVAHPLSFRAAQALIHRRYSTRLDLAKFEVADASLYPEAGACTTCSHRSGFRDEAQPTLFPDLEKPADVCTNPPCFEKKTAAVWQRARLEAKGRGLEVIDGDEAKEVFGYDGKTSQRAKYVDPAQDLPYELQKSPGKPSTWAKTLGKKLAEVPTVLVQDPSGAPRELLDRAKAMEILVAAGKVDKPTKATRSGADKASKDWKAQQDKDKAHREIRDRALNKMATAAITAAMKLEGKRELAWWRWVAEWLLEISTTSLSEDSAVCAGLDKKKPWNKQLLERANTVSKLQQLVTGLVFADLVENTNNDPKEGGLIMIGAKLLGIDAFAVTLAEVKAADKEAEKHEAVKKPVKKGAGK